MTLLHFLPSLALLSFPFVICSCQILVYHIGHLSPQTEPTAAPLGVSAYNISSTSLLISWNPPPKGKQNGIIRRYTVYFHARNLPKSDAATINLNSTALQTLINGLNIFTYYKVSVSASTKVGEGPQSNEVTVRTDEDRKQIIIIWP